MTQKASLVETLSHDPSGGLARLAQSSAPGAAEWPRSGGRGVVGASRECRLVLSRADAVKGTARGEIHERFMMPFSSEQMRVSAPVTRLAPALCSILLGQFTFIAILQQGCATWRCYHDRGCGTASPSLTRPARLVLSRDQCRDGRRGQPQMALL
jgi:hypothetical protein